MKAKLEPTTQQEHLLREWAGQARRVYNLAVEQHAYYVRGGARVYPPSSAEQSAQLTELRAEIDWLRSGPVKVQQQALRDFWSAMNNFFRNPAHFRPPTRRRKHQSTFKVITDKPTLRIDSRRKATVFIPKIGRVRVRLHKRDYTAALTSTSYRVTLRPDGWHIAFITDYRGREIEPREDRTPVGVDLGVTTTVVLSNGQHYRAPYRPKAEQRIEGLQARRDASPRGSKQRKALSNRIASLQHRESNRRTNWREKVTTRLVEQHDVIAVEDLPVANMRRKPKPKPDPDRSGQYLPNGAAAKAGLNRGLARSGFGAFRMRLEQKAAIAKQPTSVVAVNPRHTSQTCSQCGHTDKENRKTQAQFICLSCGFQYHADHNAARNILSRAQAPASAGGQTSPARTLVFAGSALGDARE